MYCSKKSGRTMLGKTVDRRVAAAMEWSELVITVLVSAIVEVVLLAELVELVAVVAIVVLAVVLVVEGLEVGLDRDLVCFETPLGLRARDICRAKLLLGSKYSHSPLKSSTIAVRLAGHRYKCERTPGMNPPWLHSNHALGFLALRRGSLPYAESLPHQPSPASKLPGSISFSELGLSKWHFFAVKQEANLARS
jgi:hypothetical protein